MYVKCVLVVVSNIKLLLLLRYVYLREKIKKL